MQIFIDVDAEVLEWDEERAKQIHEILEQNLVGFDVLNVEIRVEGEPCNCESCKEGRV